jgi:hypothetical protein
MKNDTLIRKLRKENKELHETIADYREYLQVAQNFSPMLYRCADCNSVVARGYCCGGCGSSNPRELTKRH